MDKGYEKEAFRTVCIKKSVLQKFKGFSKRQGKSHSMTLLAMVEFFDHNGISPDERMNETIAGLKYLIKKRFNAMVAIMRSIEKEQTLPTVSMIQALFQQTEKQTPSNPELLDTEIQVPKIVHEHLKEEMEALKRDFKHVLDHVVPVKNRLGKDYLKLDLDPELIERYQQKIKNP